MIEQELETPPKKPARVSWKRVFKTVGILISFGLVAAGIYFFVNARPIKIAWANLAHDRREHFLDCVDLPFYGQVQKAALEHGDIAAKVRALSGISGFADEQIPCVNFEGGIQFIKGDFVLTYKTRAARTQAEKLIGPTFFGLPYRGYQD